MRASMIVAVACGATVWLTACDAQEPERLAQRPGPATPIPASVCSPITYGGSGRPIALIIGVGPLQGDYGSHGLQNAQAVKLVLAKRRWRAGELTVGVQICDEASTESGAPSPTRCARNARAIARNRSVLGVIGPNSSTCAAAMLATLNRAPGGPVPTISPANTYLGLTRSGPGVGSSEPARHYPTGRRHYARLAPADDAQAAASVAFAERMDVRRVFVLNDETAYGRGLAVAFQTSARRAGVAVAGMVKWDARARSYSQLAERIRRADVDGVFLGGEIVSNGPRLVRDLRAGLGRNVQLLAPDSFAQASTIVEAAGAGAEGFTTTIASPPNRVLPPAGRRFAAEFERRFGQRPCCYSIHAAQAAQIMLDAIARSNGSRDQVTANVFATRVRDGLLGSFEIDRYGDTTLTDIAVYRIEAGRLRFATLISPERQLLARK